MDAILLNGNRVFDDHEKKFIVILFQQSFHSIHVELMEKIIYNLIQMFDDLDLRIKNQKNKARVLKCGMQAWIFYPHHDLKQSNISPNCKLKLGKAFPPDKRENFYPTICRPRGHFGYFEITNIHHPIAGTGPSARLNAARCRVLNHTHFRR